jgi:hypothetical protein
MEVVPSTIIESCVATCLIPIAARATAGGRQDRLIYVSA